MANKSYKRVKCKCGKVGFLTVLALSCIEDAGLVFLCDKCDEREVFKLNAKV